MCETWGGLNSKCGKRKIITVRGNGCVCECGGMYVFVCMFNLCFVSVLYDRTVEFHKSKFF